MPDPARWLLKAGGWLLKHGCWVLEGGRWVLFGRLALPAGSEDSGASTSPRPLSRSPCRTSTRISSPTVLGRCQPPAPRPGGQVTASRWVSPRGCPPQWHYQGLCPAHCSALWQVRRVSLHPARRPTETFTSPVIAGTRLQAADTGPTDADRSVSVGHRGTCRGAGGHPPEEVGGWNTGSPCPPSLSPAGGQWLLLAVLAGLTKQRGHLALGQHRPLQRLRQQPQPEVTAEHFG